MKYMHMISRERGHSKGQGVGVKGRLELSRKFICFGTVTRPLRQWQKNIMLKKIARQHKRFHLPPAKPQLLGIFCSKCLHEILASPLFNLIQVEVSPCFQSI